MDTLQTKDDSVQELLARLSRDLPHAQWVILDHWDADRHAIGIAKRSSPEIFIYVSTYQQPRGFYYYECENSDALLLGDLGRTGESASYETLLCVAQRLLGVHQ